MKFSIVLTLGSLVLTQYAFAMGAARPGRNRLHTEAECTDAEPLSARPELQDFFNTPRDQADLSDCFANAAADVATFVTGTPISALDLYFLDEGATHRNIISRIDSLKILNKGLYEGGDTRKTLQAGISAGFCPESIVPSLTDSSYITDLESFIHDKRTPYHAIGDFVLEDSEVDEVSKVFPSLTESQIADSLGSSGGKNINDVLNSLTLKACTASQRIRVQEKYSVVQKSKLLYLSDGHDLFRMDFGSRSDLIRALDFALDHEKTIAAVGIHSNDLLTPDLIVPRADFHAVTILGRHWENGQCWYALRNSWGDDQCEDYPTDKNSLTCDPKTGIAQISEAKLRQMILQVTYLRQHS